MFISDISFSYMKDLCEFAQMKWSSFVASLVDIPLHILPPIMDTRYFIVIFKKYLILL